MTSKDVKIFKPENPETESAVQQNPQRKKFRFFIKHEMELNDQNMSKQYQKRLHIRTWKLNGERQHTNQLERKLKLLETKILKFRNSTEGLVLENFNLSRISKTKLDRINKRLKKQSSFKGFTYLLSQHYNPLQNNDLRGIYELTKRVDHLKKIEFYIGDAECYHNITNEGFHYLANTLKKKEQLQDIQLCFEGCDLITDIAMQEVYLVLKSLVTLKNIKLSFIRCEKITGTDESLEDLNKCWQNLNLESLSLGFSECNFTDRGVQSLTQDLGQMDSLRDVRFIFQKCQEISHKGVESLAENLKKLKFIERIEMIFSSLNVTKTKLEEICKELQAMPSVKYVNVSEEL